MSNGLEPWVSGLLSSEGLDRRRLPSSVVCNEGAAEAAPSLWVVVVVCGGHARRLFMPVHVSDGTLNFGIGATALCQV